MDAPTKARSGKREAAPDDQLARDRDLRLPLRVLIQNQLAKLALRGGIDNGAEQREAAALAVDVVLARRKRDVAAAPASAALFPDRKSNQLHSFQRPFAEVEFGVGKLARRVASIVWRDLDCHRGCSLFAEGRTHEQSSRSVPRQ